jgi:hypothetical protein
LHLFYVGDEAISTTRHSLDVLITVFALAQRFSQEGNIDRKIVLFHDRVGPNNLNQLISFDDLTAVFHECYERLERFKRKLNGFSIMKQ